MLNIISKDFNFAGQQIKTFVDAVDKYAQLGLRTLCLGWRELSLEEYLEWSRLFKEANSALIDREVIVILISFILIYIMETKTVILVFAVEGCRGLPEIRTHTGYSRYQCDRGSPAGINFVLNSSFMKRANIVRCFWHFLTMSSGLIHLYRLVCQKPLKY